MEGDEEPSLLRSDELAHRVGRRVEFSAQAGRLVMWTAGGLVAATGLGLWTTLPRPAAEGFLALGGVLVALGVAQHLLLRRDRAHRPEALHVWEEGVELILQNGEIRAVSWTDPKLALDLFVRPLRKSKDEEILLQWRMDPKVPTCLLSVEGLARLREAAIAHGLEYVEYQPWSGKRAMRGYEIRPPKSEGPPDRRTSDSRPAAP